MIRILFDNQPLALARFGGVPNYIVGSLTSLLREPDLECIIPSVDTYCLNVASAEAGLSRRIPINPRVLSKIPYSGRLERQLYQLISRPSNHGKVEILHKFWYEGSSLDSVPHEFLATTVYDMIPEDHPDLWPESPHQGKSSVITKSDLVFCISDYTRRRLLAHLPELKARTIVTPLGIDPGVYRCVGEQKRDGVIYVGSRARYKNWATLVLAISEIAQPRIPVRCVGGGRWRPDERSLLGDHDLTDNFVLVHADDLELGLLLNRSLMYVSTSLDEGFGLPTVEAMACGTIPVLPRIDVNIEVAGEAAIYYEPGDAVDLAFRIESVLRDAQLQEELRSAAVLRSRRFRWAHTAQLMAAAYRDLIEDERSGRPGYMS